MTSVPAVLLFISPVITVFTLNPNPLSNVYAKSALNKLDGNPDTLVVEPIATVAFFALPGGNSLAPPNRPY